MKRMGIFIGAVAIACLLATFNSSNTIFANSCCGVKKDARECNKEGSKECIIKASADEGPDSKCPVCGKASDSEGQQVDVEHDGETAHLCCEGCANAYKEDPDKYNKDEDSGMSYRQKHLKQQKVKKKKKERGSGYY